MSGKPVVEAEDSTCGIEEVSKYCMATDLGLECVCSMRSTVKLGTGTTAKKEDSTLYFYAKQIEDDLLALQSLNSNWAPSGPITEVAMEELITQYQPEVELFLTKVKPVIQSIAKAVAKGDRHRANGKPYSAELEYNNALSLDEKNVRALFGLGLTYLQFDQHEKAKVVFEQLIALEGFAEAEYKHLFNQFGIELRKQNMIEESRRYYSRAIEVCSTDENLYFNLARAFYQGGKYQEAENMLMICLKMNPAHAEGNCFLRYISKISID